MARLLRFGLASRYFCEGEAGCKGRIGAKPKIVAMLAA